MGIDTSDFLGFTEPDPFSELILTIYNDVDIKSFVDIRIYALIFLTKNRLKYSVLILEKICTNRKNI